MRGDSNLSGYLYKEYEKVEPLNEDTMQVTKVYCNHFACGKQLTLIETLCGNKCIGCSQIKPLKFSNGLL